LEALLDMGLPRTGLELTRTLGRESLRSR